jgi:chromosome segregation ATPase
MLGQMAEALEDQVAALYRRAAAFEEEEFLLNREVEERQTEINRLMLKLDAMRAERDRVTERIESISREAAAMREELFSGEDEVALDSIERSAAVSSTSTACSAEQPHLADDDAQGARFFRRVILGEAVTQRLSAQLVSLE